VRRPAILEARLIPWCGAGLLVAAAMRWFTRHAGPNELNWILAPTARLASIVSGIDFERELHAGWVSHTHRMILGPGCSGRNFMIIAFSALFFSYVPVFRRPAHRWGWLGTSLAASYLLTVTTNAIRIVAAIQLYRLDIYGDLLTPGRVHRLAGVLIYCTSLLLAFLAAGRFLSEGGPRSALVPIGWYLALVLGVPLANRATVSQPVLFLDHAAIVLTVCALLAAAVLCLPRSGGARILSRNRPGSR
jgi:exosortase K